MKPQEPGDNQPDAIRTVGMLSSLSLALMTLLTLAMAIATPPLSGPFAAAHRISYPYSEAISRFPRDYYWMYAALVMILIYVVYMVSIDCWTRPERKIFSRIALILAAMGAGTIFVNYFLQLAVIQPSLLNGEADGIALLTQYNPHGIFIALEEAGYLLMAVSLLALAPVFAGLGRSGAVLSGMALLSFMATVVAGVWISISFGINREYRFEVAVISIDFIALIMLGTLSFGLFRSQAADPADRSVTTMDKGRRTRRSK